MNRADDIVRLESLKVHFQVRGSPFDWALGRKGKQVRAVDGVDLAIGRNEIVALVGESGSGKTTIGRVIAKLEAPTGGRLIFDGDDVTETQGSRVLRPYRRRVQMIFQDAYQALNPRHTVFDAVAEPVRSLKLAKDAGELETRVSEALSAAGLNPPSEFFGRFPHELSGGQRQRVVVAGALAVRPDVIVADEPVSMLDVSIRSQILQVLMNLNEEFGLALLFITHDLPLAWLIADRIAVMYLGRLVEIGTADEITFQPRHPYTLALRNATPKVHRDPSEAAMPPLQGETPSAGQVPAGCRFHTRCPFAHERCREEEPPEFQVNEGHMSSCWLEEDPDRTHKMLRNRQGDNRPPPQKPVNGAR
jgi:oligopeptide/dipeptide ABC transporter ATP-binding protein